MFDYIPDYAEKMVEEVLGVKDENIKSLMTNAVKSHIYRSVAEEYDRVSNDEHLTETFHNFCKKYDYIVDEMDKIFYLLEYSNRAYGIDVIYDIVSAVEKVTSDIIQEKTKQHSIEYIFIHEIPEGKQNGYQYKPTLKREGAEMANAIISGMCCSLCSHYINGECHNPIYLEFEVPHVEPWEICECISFDGRKYRGYYFDGSSFVQVKTNDVKENFAQVAVENINALKNIISENEDFISFIKEEIPSVYSKLRKEYKIRKCERKEFLK